jgi:hypothetical protein
VCSSDLYLSWQVPVSSGLSWSSSSREPACVLETLVQPGELVEWVPVVHAVVGDS